MMYAIATTFFSFGAHDMLSTNTDGHARIVNRIYHIKYAACVI